MHFFHRESLRAALAGTYSSLIGLLLGICAVSPVFGQSFVVDEVVGVVGTKPIKLSEVESQYIQAKMQGEKVDPGMKCLIFERMLEQKLLASQAEIDSLEVTNMEVQGQIDERLNGLVQRYGSDAEIEKLSGRTILELREDWYPSVKEQLLAERMQSSVVKDIKVAPTDVRKFYSRYEKDSIPRIEEQIEVAQILMNAPFKEEAIDEARQILLECRGRILKGESFKTLAVLYSDEPAAIQTGGELGFISKSSVDPDFAKAAFALKKPGDVSRIVESKFGLHIIQLIAKRGDQVNVRHIIRKPKLDEEVVSKVLLRLDSIAGMIRADSFTFEAGARFISQDEKTRNNGGLMVNQNTGGTRFDLNSLSPEDLKAVKDLKVGEISKPYQAVDEMGNAVFKIAMVKNRFPAHIANLSQDYEYLLQLATAEKRREHYTSWLQDKIKKIYVLINDPYKQCVFSESAWLK